MNPRLAFVLFAGFVVFALIRDTRRRQGVSAGSWLALCWMVIFASRPFSAWFQSGVVYATSEGYLEGSPIDRVVSLLLILAGYVVLGRRRIALGAITRQNAWLLAFYTFCALSVLWSDFPFVAFKRWFKDFGAVVMALILLTDEDPVEAVKAAFVRCAYILVPFSVLFIRYFPDLGRTFFGYQSNRLMYVGVATHKNTLGALAFVSVVFLLWDLRTRRRGTATVGRPRYEWAEGSIVLLMAIWILAVADSATATVCTVGGVMFFYATELLFVRRMLKAVELFALLGAGAWFAADSLFNFTELVVTSLGRDMNLTSRADGWKLFLSVDINPFIGAGFKTFWAGERMDRIWREFGTIVQAHNGYLETYLEGGFIGLFLLAAMLWAGFRHIKRHVVAGEDFGRIRLLFWFLALGYNFSEAGFTQLSLFWMVTLAVLIEVPCLSAVAVAMPERKQALTPAPIVVRSKWAVPAHRSGRFARRPLHKPS